ncbi:MAG: phage head morphogenesis protein [Deltaproteobacteria bacterium]|nr:phage head morphogenesis protein [Deltaproteobacteria bacterium]
MPEIALEPLPFQEAADYFGDRVPMTPEQFAALAADARTTAFMVSGVARMDLCVGIHDAILKAIEEGETLAEFQDRVDDIFAAQGFIASEEGLGAWRLETIFRTNIQTAYNVGRYRQLVDLKDRFPYWEYDAVNDSNTRPEHAALDGKVFPADSPFWDTWYPPNGFNCRCGVLPIHKYAAEEENLTIETEDPTGKLIEPIDAAGNRLPARLLIPDPGFSRNPAKDPWQPDLSKYPEPLRGRFEKEMNT